jgi:hypothetical protein
MAIDPNQASAQAADPYPKPRPKAGYEEKKPPGSIARGLSTALMQSAFSKFGEAFTDTGDVKKDAASRNERLAPYNASGEGVAAALEGRWHQMEMDNFNNEFIEPFIASKKGMLDDYERRHAMAELGIFEGPDGNPIQVPLDSKEGRLRAGKMTNALVTRFFSINGDMDLELFNEAGKYSSNPLITNRAIAIEQAASATFAMVTNPVNALGAQNVQSQIRRREDESEIGRERNRLMAADAQSQKRARSYAEALAHPNIGHAGLVQWLRGDPDGLAVLHSKGGGGSFVTEERRLVEARVHKDFPDLEPLDDEFIAKVESHESQYVLAAALKFIASQNPADLDKVKEESPHFFKESGPGDAAIVSDKRMSPDRRQSHVDTWRDHAERHFDEYMSDPANPPGIDAAMANLDEWLRAAIYGETGEDHLKGSTAARGKGTKRLVDQILTEVPEHISKWWATKGGGSGIGQEENPRRAGLLQMRAGGGKRGRMAAAELRDLKQKRKKKGDGGLNLP